MLAPGERHRGALARVCLGASRLKVQQRRNHLDVIFDAMLQLPHEELIAPRQRRVALDALKQPVDQQAVEARHHGISDERRESGVEAGCGRIWLREQENPGAGAAEEYREDARPEPAEECSDDHCREDRDERDADQRVSEQQAHSDRKTDECATERVGQQRPTAYAAVPEDQFPSRSRQRQSQPPCQRPLIGTRVCSGKASDDVNGPTT
jgi:hypothetical protein